MSILDIPAWIGLIGWPYLLGAVLNIVVLVYVVRQFRKMWKEMDKHFEL